MDDRRVYRQNRGVRHKLLWSVLATTGAIYVAIVIWALGVVTTDPPTIVWIGIIVPTVVLGGAFLVWRRPANPIGELLAWGALAIFAIPAIIETPTIVAFDRSGAQDWMWAPMWAVMTLSGIGVVALSALIVLLPDGRIRSRRERRFVTWSWLVVAFPTLSLVSNEFVITHSQAFPGVADVPSPLQVGALEPFGEFLASLVSLGYGIFVIAIVLQVMRYRKAPVRERRQVRWVLYAGVISVFLGVIPYLLEGMGLIAPIGHTLVASLLALGPTILFAASVVVAVMEPKWIDIDIVIRKSVVYGALSFIILLLYVAAAAAFGLFAAGAQLPIEFAVFLTVIVAILFQPARRWLQGLADRWVFGNRPTKYEAVTQIGATIKEATDPTVLLPRLVDTIRRALRLSWVRVELHDSTSARVGEGVGAAILSVPIVSGSEHLGLIDCGPKSEGTLDEEEVQLVHTLAGQVALAVANARLAGRIVNAAEAERRRIERNIHDGAQQELVALVARLGMARAEAESRDLSPDTLAELQQEARRILADLRDLAQGIHPSVLTDGGVLEAVEERCSHLPIDVSLEASPGLRDQRFADEIEGAAYFFVTESLANVLKHAGASEAKVTLQGADGLLAMVVADNGEGFNPADTSENGLAGLRDRISALGGSVDIVTSPGSGTSVSAMLPIE
jgi:signal transduction histidine kinase